MSNIANAVNNLKEKSKKDKNFIEDLEQENKVLLRKSFSQDNLISSLCVINNKFSKEIDRKSNARSTAN